MAIQSFRHKGLKRFFATGAVTGIQPAHAARLRLLLGVLNAAAAPRDVSLPGLRLHELKGSRKGVWSVNVSGNWRVTFRFGADGIEDVDYQDYH